MHAHTHVRTETYTDTHWSAHDVWWITRVNGIRYSSRGLEYVCGYEHDTHTHWHRYAQKHTHKSHACAHMDTYDVCTHTDAHKALECCVYGRVEESAWMYLGVAMTSAYLRMRLYNPRLRCVFRPVCRPFLLRGMRVVLLLAWFRGLLLCRTA